MDVGKKVFIDTAPFIYLIENHPIFGVPTEQYLSACAEGESKLFTSVISRDRNRPDHCRYPPGYTHSIENTGQNYDYELNEIFFSDLGIKKPQVHLDAAGHNASETIGQVIAKIDPVLESLSPDAMLVLGDTNSCLRLFRQSAERYRSFHGGRQSMFRSTRTGRNQQKNR